MKKSILLLVLCAIFVSCKKVTYTPIEKYKGCIVMQEPFQVNNVSSEVCLKNKDSIFYVYVHNFDTINLKPGDTIK